METYYRYSTTARHRKKQRPRATLNSTTYFVVGVLGIFLLLILALLLGAFLYLQVFGLILPGVQIKGIAMGGLSRTQAAVKIEQAWEKHNRLVVSDGQRVWSAAPGDFGLLLDVQATTEQAYRYGRGPAASFEIQRLLSGVNPNFSPVIRFYPEIAGLELERWADQIDIDPQEAVLIFSDGRWQAIPGKNGVRLDLGQTLQHIQSQQTEIISGGFLRLETQVIPPQVIDLSAELQRLQALLDRPVAIEAYDPITNETIRWTIPQEQFSGLLHVYQNEGQPAFLLDQQALDGYLRTEQSRLGSARSFEPIKDIHSLNDAWKNGRSLIAEVRHDPTQYTIQPGDTLVAIGLRVGMPYWKILEANPHLMPESTLSTGQTLIIPSKNEMLPLPIVPGKRIIVSISLQRMWTYENGSQRSEHVISTGIDRSPTHPGVYQVQTHELMAYASVWDLYMPHFLGIYEGWPGFMNGIHGLPTLSNGSRMWANSLGRKASYGCIIMDLQAAENLYYWAEDGVVVEIQP
jgi:LysM repeat protein